MNPLNNQDLPQFIKDLLNKDIVRKCGAHTRIFRLACLLLPWRGEEEAFRLIRAAAKDPRIPNREIKEAIRCARLRGDLWQPGANSQQYKKTIQPSKPFDLKKWLDRHCPFSITEDCLRKIDPHIEFLEKGKIPIWQFVLSMAFYPCDNICLQHWGDDPPPQMAKSSVEWIRSDIEAPQFICLNPVASVAGVEKVRDNGTVFRSVRCLDNIQERRFCVVEFDELDIPTQLRIHGFLSTKLPLFMLTHSAGISVHGIYSTVGFSEEYINQLYLLLGLLGVDKNCKDRCRLTRTPGAIRRDRDENGKVIVRGEQRLLYIDPKISGVGEGLNPDLRQVILSIQQKGGAK